MKSVSKTPLTRVELHHRPSQFVAGINQNRNAGGQRYNESNNSTDQLNAVRRKLEELMDAEAVSIEAGAPA